MPKKKYFNIEEAVAEADKLLEVKVPKLNVIVKYKQLTNADMLEIVKVKNNEAQGFETLFYLLHRGDPAITKKKLMKMSPYAAALILRAITSETPIITPPIPA